MGIVYMLTNVVTSKKYIGVTSKSIELRWNQHVEASLSGAKFHLHKAIRKYGVESFTREIIEECDDQHMFEREKFWIATYDSMTNGYNMTLGGDGVVGLMCSAVTRAKISASLKGHHVSDVTRDKIRRKRLGCKSGVRMRRKTSEASKQRFSSEEFCEKHRLACKNAMHQLSDEKKLRLKSRSRRVQQFSKDGVLVKAFDSIVIAANEMGVSSGAISHVLNGRSQYCKGFVWKYENS